MIRSDDSITIDFETEDNNKNINGYQRRVSFSDVPETFSILNSDELEKENIWWTRKDIQHFRTQAKNEVLQYMKLNPYLQGRAVLTQLYQP
jgi:hypothetical protein